MVDGGFAVRSGGWLTVHFTGCGLPTDLFNSSEYTLPELPRQQNQPLTLQPRRACLRINSRYWGNRGLLECIMYDQISSLLLSPRPSIRACHSAFNHPRINTSPPREISFLIFGRLHREHSAVIAGEWIRRGHDLTSR